MAIIGLWAPSSHHFMPTKPEFHHAPGLQRYVSALHGDVWGFPESNSAFRCDDTTWGHDLPCTSNYVYLYNRYVYIYIIYIYFYLFIYFFKKNIYIYRYIIQTILCPIDPLYLHLFPFNSPWFSDFNRIYTHTHVLIHTHTHIHMHTYTYTHIHTHIYIHTYTCTYTHIHTYMEIYIYIYVCVCVFAYIYIYLFI